MMFIRRVAILLATALFLQPGVSTMAADKSDFVQRTDEPASAQEQDILETVARHTLGVQVKTKDGFWKPAKYGDPKLAEAVEHLGLPLLTESWIIL